MKTKILAIAFTLMLTSGCATKQYQLGSEPQMANACGQSVDVAIEGAVSVEATAKDCQQMKEDAKTASSGSDLVLQILGYAAGFALGTALF